MGGCQVGTGYCEILRGNETIQLKSKDKVSLRKGDIVTLAVGGGAGYGRPGLRSAESRGRDVAEGYVSTA